VREKGFDSTTIIHPVRNQNARSFGTSRFRPIRDLVEYVGTIIDVTTAGSREGAREAAQAQAISLTNQPVSPWELTASLAHEGINRLPRSQWRKHLHSDG